MEVFEEGRGQHFGCTGQSGAEIGTYICTQILFFYSLNSKIFLYFVPTLGVFGMMSSIMLGKYRYGQTLLELLSLWILF